MLLGPTASGKTALSIELLDRFQDSFPMEIISIDSALVYRDMNIGTAKPDRQTLARYPHHLIDIIDPNRAYSAAAFCDDANRLITEIVARGRVPLIVGGTMMYANALLEGISVMPTPNQHERRRINEEAEKVGWPAMHAQLAEVDAVTAARLSPNDSQRIQRALEVYRGSGQPISVWQQRKTAKFEPNFTPHMIALIPFDRRVLHERIEMRFEQMVLGGLLKELAALREKYGLTVGMPSMRAVGYRQAWNYMMAGDDSPKAHRYFLDTGIAATRQLAKRQITWLRSMEQAEIFDSCRKDLRDAVTGSIARFLRQPLP